ncbi:hypothetical protein ASE55_19745 [Chryseobacterium sp. Leaf201]|nr:hypothetical protein ASE55_19745 [Chryseobacterium sp. Leaf201]
MIICPKCNSEQITLQKKGFGFGKAIAGIFIAGPLGLLAGTLGANKIQVHCLNCGNKWLHNNLHKTITASIPQKKQSKHESLPKDKTEEERRREIYEKTGLSASDPKFGNFRTTKKRK